MWFQSSKDLKFDSCDNLEGLVLLELEASQFVAWLHGNQDTGGGKHHIGLATSPDMLIWTMYGENPILQPGNDGEWDEHRVENAFVAKDDLGTDTLRIWYSGAPSSDGEDGSAIGYATSDQRTVYMQKSDVQLGKPETLYKATKDEIEALTLPVAGMEAYATDTKVTGFYNGSNWMWNDWGRVVMFNDEIIVFQDDIVWTY